MARGSQRLHAALFIAIALVAASVGFLWQVRAQNVELVGLATAKAMADELALFREVYTEEVIARARRNHCAIDEAAVDSPHGLPLPISLVQLLGRRQERKFPGSQLTVFSDYPFSPRPRLTAFQQDALAAVRIAPETPFFRISDGVEGPLMEYAIADRMSAACVACHNAHPRSPKRDWKVGDVRGVVHVTVPMKDALAQLSKRDLGFATLLIATFISIVAAIAFFVRHDTRRQAREDWALTDELTGLATRRRGVELIQQEVTRAKRYQTPTSVALFDLDHFKRINDTFGHDEGDAVLTEVAKVLQRCAREHDHIIRWGGEEFLVLLPHTTEEQAFQFAERIRVQVSELKRRTTVTVSGGVAQLGSDFSYHATVTRADEYLYRAKTGGRNRIAGALSVATEAPKD